MRYLLLLSIAVLALAACQPIEPTAPAATDDYVPVDVNEILENQSDAATSEPALSPGNEQLAPNAEPAQPAVSGPIPTVTVTEGDVVNFPNLKAVDPDGDALAYTFSSPVNSSGQWQTKDGDAGEYPVVITASDGTSQATTSVKIVVEARNKAPVLEFISGITAKEGTVLKLSPKALDPEGKPVTITYTGWMTSDTKELSYTDAGVHTVKVMVSDGEKEIAQDVQITVEDVNRAPVFERVI